MIFRVSLFISRKSFTERIDLRNYSILNNEEAEEDVAILMDLIGDKTVFDARWTWVDSIVIP